MPWFGMLPGFVGAVVLLVVPGLLLGWALGLKGIWVLSLAPVLTAFLVAASTLASWWFGLEWSAGVFALAIVMLSGFSFIAINVAAKRWPHRSASEPNASRLTPGYGVALLASGLILTIRYIQIVEHPSNINQGIDAPFHLNLARQILESGDGSPYSVRGLLGDTSGLYPQIWHALLAMTVTVTGMPLVEAANALNYATVAVSWPLGVLLFVYMITGPRVAALLTAAAASAGFFAFPFTLMQSQKSDFGPLFPYMLAVTFLPPLISVVASVLKFGRAGFIPWPIAALTFLMGLFGVVSTHMAAVVALVGLCWPFAAIAAWRFFRELRQQKAEILGYLRWTACWISVLTGVLLTWVVVRPWTTTWDPIDSVPAAILSVLVTTPTHGEVAWGPALLALVGTGLAILRPAERWFLAAYVGAASLYVIAAAAPDPLFRRIVIGAWYGDPPRLAALLPMFWAVLAGLAGAYIFEKTRRSKVRWIVPVGTAALAASVIVFPTNSETTPGRERTYAFNDSSPLLSPDEFALMKRLSAHVPPDAVIANNPWDGSSTAYAIGDRRVLFAHAYTGSNKDRLLAAKKLNQAIPGSNVCKAVERENIQFLLDLGGDYIDPEREEVNDFPGLEVPDGSLSFVLVDKQGPATLYRFVGCDA